jgi:hypothetical protein
MTFHSYPTARDGVAAVSSTPTYTYHTWRVHDYSPNYNSGVFWRALHNANGDFTGGTSTTSWADLDTAVDLHYAAGRNVSYSIWGTPGWAASDPAQADPYGGLGGNTPPSSNTYLSDFVTRLVTRYNTDSIRNNGGAKKIKYIETWNEPTYEVSSTSFFTGSASQMAAMAKTVKTAAQAVDPTITLLGPSFTGTSRVTSFLNASDGGAGFGRDHIDAIAYHPYAADVPGLATLNTTSNIIALDTELRAAIVAGGLASSFPVYGMEQAIAASVSSSLLNRPAEWKAKYVFRVSAIQAALGWKKVTWYSHDDVFFGYPANSNLISGALAAVASLAGKTITAIQLLSNGVFRVTHSTGIIEY